VVLLANYNCPPLSGTSHRHFNVCSNNIAVINVGHDPQYADIVNSQFKMSVIHSTNINYLPIHTSVQPFCMLL